jgi:hypothetical protein
MTLYTRKETSLKTGIPSDTLRYYEKERVIPTREKDDPLLKVSLIRPPKAIPY